MVAIGVTRPSGRIEPSAPALSPGAWWMEVQGRPGGVHRRLRLPSAGRLHLETSGGLRICADEARRRA